jgi:rRNA methylase, putative
MIEAGFSVRGLDFSPIQGGQGNVEFLAYLEKSTEPQSLDSAMMTAVVEAAHKEFKDE